MSGKGGRLRFYNTLTRTKEDFVPIEAANVRMYVCGPTVYDFAHIGNARPAIVFDVLYRLLRHVYGEAHVTYVRNITDVDDKINARALRDFGIEIDAGRLSLNEAIRRVTETTNAQYQKDVVALGCLPPTHQPRATEFVEPRADGKADMITLIERLIAAGHAYVAAGEVLFDTASMPDYGQLSKRRLDEQQAGARVEVEAHKRSPGDFVLWKLSSPEEPGWPSPWGRGRPGWHIECSAMSAAYLGEVFDIHGGGLDLIFPHHENEIAQSRCAHGTAVMANYWMHNGFLQVEGRKMSKSEGNFVTIHQLLETETFGGRPWHGNVVRYAMMKSHYQQPINWSVSLLSEAQKEMETLTAVAQRIFVFDKWKNSLNRDVDSGIIEALSDNLNFPEVIRRLHEINKSAKNETEYLGLLSSMEFLGLINEKNANLLMYRTESEFSIDDSIVTMVYAKYANGATEDEVNNWIEGRNLEFESQKGLSRPVLRSKNASALHDFYKNIDTRIAKRLAYIAAKNWAEADRIRDELLAEGVQLKDGKDPTSGERITTWEVKR